MPIPFQCPQCGESYNAPEHLAGKKIKCRACSAVVAVPSARQAPTPARETSTSQRSAAPPITKPTGSAKSAAPPKGPAAPPLDLLSKLDAGTLGAPVDLQAQSLYAAAPPRQASSGSQLLLVIGGIALGLIVLAGAGVALWWSARSAEKSNLAAEEVNPTAEPTEAPVPPQQPAAAEKAGTDAPTASNPAPGDPFAETATRRAARRAPNATPDVGAARAADLGHVSPLGTRLEVDPPRESLAFRLEPTATFSIPLGHVSADVYLPTCFSPFVCVNFQGAQVWDLRTGKPAGRIPTPLYVKTEKVALSPDGRHSAHSTTSDSIKVWSFESGMLVREVPSSKALQILDFAAPDELLIVENVLENKTTKSRVRIVNVASGQTVREFMTDDRDRVEPVTKVVTLSPGGRYLVFKTGAFRETVSIYDLSKGERTTQASAESGRSVEAVAFSPDGAELAMASTAPGQAKTHIAAWDVRSGQTSARHLVDGPRHRGTDAADVRPLFDGRGWLVDERILVDHQSGRTFFDLPEAPQGTERQFPRRPVGPGQILAATGESSGELRLTKVVISQDKVESTNPALSEVVATDPVRGPLIQIPTGQIAWSVKPDPAPPAKSLLGSKPFRLQSREQELLGVCFTSPETGQAITYSVLDKKKNWPHHNKVNPDDAVWLNRYDLLACEHLGRVEVPRGSNLMDVSPDGSRALLRVGARLDAWSLPDGKHVAGWRPNFDDDARVDHGDWTAAFIDRDHVLTVDGKRVVLWRLPDCTPVYRIDDLDIYSVPGKGCLSPGRKYFAAALIKDGSVRVGLFIESLTGKVVGATAVPKTLSRARFYGARFRPDARQIGLFYGGGSLGVACFVDSDTGRTTLEAPGAIGADCLWAGTGYLLRNQNYLFDISRRAFVWVYSTGGTCVADSPDGRIWFLVTAGHFEPRQWLATATLPEPHVLEKIRQSSVDVPPPVRPGISVAIQLDLGRASESSDKVRAEFTRRLTSHGMTVNDSSAVKLVANVTEESKTREYEKFKLGANEKFTINYSQLRCQVRMETGDGSVLWKDEHVLVPVVPAIISNESIEEAQRKVDVSGSTLHKDAEPWFLSRNIPQTLYQQAKLETLPVSNFRFPGIDYFESKPVAADNPFKPVPPGPTPTTPPRVQEKQLSPAELERACRSLVAMAYAAALTSDADAAWDKLRSCPPLARPLPGVRWALGTEAAGQAAAPRDVESFSTWSGQHMLRDLTYRVQNGEFGTFAAPEPSAADRPVVLGMSTRNKLLAAARAHWIDVLLVASVDTKVQGLGRRLETSVTMRAVDVATGDELWASEPLKQLGAVLGKQFSDYVIKGVADNCKLGPLPEITSAAAAQRLETLAGKQSAHPLAALLETHLYQRKKLIPADQAKTLYVAILGPEDGGAFADGDAAARKQLIDKRLPGWIDAQR